MAMGVIVSPRHVVGSPAAHVGRRLGEFVLGEALGGGSFGTVHRATQQALGREAVVKLLHTRLHDDPAARARFMREAQLAARIDHPYAAHVYAYGAEPDGLVWIAMEIVRGTSLAAMIGSGPIPLERFVPFFAK